MDHQQPNATIAFNNAFKGLYNYSSLCYANATMQILLELPEIRNYINRLPIDDPLRLFTQKYFTSEYSRFNPKQFYNTMQITLPDGEQDDIVSFIERIMTKYPGMRNIFGLKYQEMQEGQLVDEYRACIGIEQFNSIQEGINMTRMPTDLPSIINIAIDRHEMTNDGNSIYKKKTVAINKCVYVNNQYYKLKSIIIHIGNSDHSGHFVSIILRDNSFTFINDSRVSHSPPSDLNTQQIYKNAALCTYIRCEGALEGVFKIEDYAVTSNEQIQQPHAGTQDQELPNPRIIRDIEVRRRGIEDLHDGALFLHTSRENELIDIPKELDEIQLDDTWKNNNHESTIKTNLHEIYLYLHGFIDADLSKGPDKDIKCSDPKYQKIFDKLAMIVKILGKTRFNYKETLGNQNAENIADVLNIQALLPTCEQAKEAAERVSEYISQIDDNRIPPYQVMEAELTTILNDLIEKTPMKVGSDFYTSNTGTINQQEEEIFYSLDKSYNWKARCDELDATTITDAIIELNSNENEETNDVRKRNELRTKLWKDFLCDFHLFETKESFIHDWVSKRNTGKLDSDLTFTEGYALKILNDCIDNNGVVLASKRGGAKPKVTPEVMKCLVTTVLDFPDATDAERADYLNKFGPCVGNNICIKTVNNALKKLKITNKTPSFSPKPRNCFGYRVARIVWANIIRDIQSTSNTLICFLDEAGVVLNKRKRARGFISMIPTTNKPHFSKNISNLACVIPGFGVIYRWYNRGVHGEDYAKFIRDASFIIRNKICNEQTQIIFVNDNATIHKTENVKEMAARCKINLLYTVPYSPQMNLPAENYFCQMKHVVCYKFLAVQGENVDRRQAPIQHGIQAYKDYVLQQWDMHTKQCYDYLSTAKIYGSWLNILNMCAEGKALTGQHIEPIANFNPKSVRLYISGRMKKEDGIESSDIPNSIQNSTSL